MKNRNDKLLIAAFIVLIVILYFVSIKQNNFIGMKYISFGNSNSNCLVEKTNLDDNQIVKKYSKHNYLKLDIIQKVTPVTSQELKDIIKNTKKNQFSYGIILDNKIVLLVEEVNANEIIDYDTEEIDITRLNQLLKEKKINQTYTFIPNISLFETESKSYKNNHWISLTLKNGFHKENEYNLKEVIQNSATTLMNMNQSNGEFIYGYSANSGDQINSYNILRHAGCTWSLILYYEQYPNEELKQKIQRSIQYLINNYLVKYNENISLVIEKKGNEIKLGGNALTLLMLSDYKRVFDDNQYDDVSSKIANGILWMQQDSGKFNHVLSEDFTLKDEYRTVYYDGEATYALLKYYGLSKNEIYLNQAMKAIDYFIDHHYEQYRDHWTSYAIKELLLYNQDQKYIEFAFNNFKSNISRLNIEGFGPIRLELVLSTYSSYQYLSSIQSSVIQNFDLESLKKSININYEELMDYYIDEEETMYFKNPIVVQYGFQDITDGFRMRIDDIQHSLLAIMMYEKYLEE